MSLNKVTITGADQSIEISDLERLSKQFPFVEWGILFHKTKQGSPRYPTDKWVNQLRELKSRCPEVALSGHLCGQWVKEVCESSFTFADYLDGIASIFDRFQLNMTDDRFMTLDFGVLKIRLRNFPAAILQTKRKFQRFEWLQLLNKPGSGLPRLDMLYDCSGGKGLSPSSWAKPVDDIYCGLAGGLGPDNIESELVKIQATVGDSDYWIDMESKVRTDERFDLDKCQKVLEVCQKVIA